MPAVPVNPFVYVVSGLMYALVFGSPFILTCLAIWYWVSRLDRGARQRGFDAIRPSRTNAPDDAVRPDAEPRERREEAEGRMSWQVDYAQPQHPRETADPHALDYGRPRRSLWKSWWPVIITLVLVVGGMVVLAVLTAHP
jgi:hypothetical protein